MTRCILAGVWVIAATLTLLLVTANANDLMPARPSAMQQGEFYLAALTLLAAFAVLVAVVADLIAGSR